MAELIDRLQATLGEGYKINSELGGGGMSRVFVAEEVELGRPVVIKVLPPDLAAGLNVDRFRREIQMAARLQHPHIVPVLSAGAKDGLLYYTMPLIQGESLRARLSRAGELPVNEAARILREVADALEYAHSNGIVHRDIKPENVLLSGNHALVMDFGVAKALSEATGQTNLTSVGVALGTPTYMSPEQATADPMTDHRSDIYSLGVMGYELLAGRPPFTGNTPQQVLAAQVTETPAEINKHRAAIPPMLGTVIMKCLQKKPADRYQTAEEVRQQLEIVGTPTGGMTPHATVPVAPAKPGTFDKRRGAIIGGAAAVILLLALFAGKYIGRGSPAYEMTDAAQVTNEAGTAITPGLSPDGKLLAYAGGNPIEPVVYVRQLSGGQPVRIGQGIDPKFSPDASRVIYVNGEGIVEAPALGGTVRVLARHKPGNILMSPAYSHDGKHIAYAERGGVIVANSDGSNQQTIVKAYDPHSLAWSPDDSRIAFVSGNAWFIYGQTQFANLSPSVIRIASVKDKQAKPISDSTHLNVSPAWSSDGAGIFFVSSVRGGKDLYFQAIKGLESRGEAQRLTTGLNIHGISAANDGTVAYSVVNTRVGIWSIPIPASGSISLREAKQITNGSERIESVSMSHDGKWLAFDSDRSGNSDIYKMHPDGTGLEQLTRDIADDFRPRWSGDDKTISFHTFRGGTRDVYAMNADGSDQHLVVGGPAHEWADSWSPDGKWMAYMSDRVVPGRQDLFIMPVASGPAKHIGIGGATAWTPDGKSIAWGSGGLLGGMVITEIATGKTDTVFRESPEKGSAGETAGFSRDGNFLYFRVLDGNEMNIVRVARDGSGLTTVVRFDDPNRTSYKPDVTMDDKNLYFTIGKHEADIWRVHIAKK
jgi:serine/threonine-protein kinase